MILLWIDCEQFVNKSIFYKILIIINPNGDMFDMVTIISDKHYNRLKK